MGTFIWVTLQFEGYHSWPDAPMRSAFLRNEHRHMFHVKLYQKVTHLDRDVEFIELKNKLQDFITRTWPGGQLGSISCEMIATHILSNFGGERCDVSEDGENGALVIRSSKD